MGRARWQDVHTLSQHFRPLFLALLEALTRAETEPAGPADDDEFASGAGAVFCDLLKLAARFIFYYELRSPGCESSAHGAADAG